MSINQCRKNGPNKYFKIHHLQQFTLPPAAATATEIILNKITATAWPSTGYQQVGTVSIKYGKQPTRYYFICIKFSGTSNYNFISTEILSAQGFLFTS